MNAFGAARHAIPFDREAGDKKVYALQKFRSACIFRSQRTQNHTPFCRSSNDHRALFEAGVCTRVMSGATLELRMCTFLPPPLFPKDFIFAFSPEIGLKQAVMAQNMF